jgi:hypothetical protein
MKNTEFFFLKWTIINIHAAQSVLLMSKVEIIPMSKVKSQKYTIKNISVTPLYDMCNPLYDSVKILWAACIELIELVVQLHVKIIA